MNAFLAFFRSGRLVRMAACLVALASLGLLSACGAVRQQQGTPVPPEQAVAAWNAYDIYATDRESENGPYRVNASVRFGEKGDTRRVVVLIWGNGDTPQKAKSGDTGTAEALPGAIRMDVMAGLGPLVARLREAPGEFIAYTPRENSAMVYHGRGRVRVNIIGSPLPFGLRDFTALLRGRFHEVFGPAEGLHPVFTPKGNIVYTLEGGDRDGSLELRPDGLPARWQEKGSKGWSMSLDYEAEENGVLRPYKMVLEDPEGRNAIFLVKNRERPGKHFSAEQLALPLPPETKIEPVREGRL